ncbi:hypothetical protein CCY01nite_07290 [Chitinophaga cymbidii]|uniref:Uncharacterized protein n=1 Tax=Chitinophaga cymbidii TaxID=1096750 RepID=A0A512RFI2_9BACT|nr:hypothetical protein CCY01nite_07290 [Chitinophaga cymbidii]
MDQSEEQQIELAHGFAEIRPEICHQWTGKIKHKADRKLNMREGGGEMPHGIIRPRKRPPAHPSGKAPEHTIQKAEQHQPTENGMKE